MGRPWRFFVTSCTAGVLLGGCYDDSIYDDLVDLNEAYADSSTSGSSSNSGPTSVTVTATGGGTTSDGSDTATTSGTESASGGEGEGETEPQIALDIRGPHRRGSSRDRRRAHRGRRAYRALPGGR